MVSIKNVRTGSALRGALAASAATVVLLGGFGAFALWSETQNGGAAGNIQTGHLALDPISGPISWQLENPQGGGAAVPIDLATYLASPGDIISYTVPVTGEVSGTDITAELNADLSGVVVDPELASDVAISVSGANGDPITVVGTEGGNTFTHDATVRVEFADDMTGGMSLPQAVALDGLNLVLQQK